MHTAAIKVFYGLQVAVRRSRPGAFIKISSLERSNEPSIALLETDKTCHSLHRYRKRAYKKRQLFCPEKYEDATSIDFTVSLLVHYAGKIAKRSNQIWEKKTDRSYGEKKASITLGSFSSWSSVRAVLGARGKKGNLDHDAVGALQLTKKHRITATVEREGLTDPLSLSLLS